MNTLQLLKQDADTRQWRFLVIGGHAVYHYGWSRETADLDILVSSEQKQPFVEWFLERGYTIYHEADAFTQFAAPSSAWPIDCMWVSQQTFDKIFSEAVRGQISGVEVLLPELHHLLALKVHSLKNAHIHRFLKDFQDIVGLIEINKLDPTSQKIRAIFQKYGTEELYEKVLRACSNH